MIGNTKEEALRPHYDELPLTGDERVTALDYNLRELEIELALEYIRDGDAMMDVGCGFGTALRRYATKRTLCRAVGIDFAENMVAVATSRSRTEGLADVIECHRASATDLPFEADIFDVVTSHRCLLALLEWETQSKALDEMHRVLKPGGILLLMEGVVQGLRRLNSYRQAFGLPVIEEGGRDGYERTLFDEHQLLAYLSQGFELLRIQRFGMYYFLTRILQPLFVAPEAPRYDHRINDVAREIARVIPDFEGIGRLVGFVMRKRN